MNNSNTECMTSSWEDIIDPIILKLSTGEEVISLNAEFKDGLWWINNPYTIHKILQGRSLLYELSPLTIMSDSNQVVKVKDEHIIYVTIPGQEMIEYYLKLTIKDKEGNNNEPIEQYEASNTTIH